MKYIDLINESIQKMANKPSGGAIMAAQSIAKEMDDALVNMCEIEWKYLPIQNSETIDVINVTNKPSFVCRIYDKNMGNDMINMFDQIDGEMTTNQVEMISDLMTSINQAINH